MAHFLEKQGFKTQALAVSTDIDHKCGWALDRVHYPRLHLFFFSRFELALQLKDVRIAYELAKKSEVGGVLLWGVCFVVVLVLLWGGCFVVGVGVLLWGGGVFCCFSKCFHDNQ